MKQTVIAHCATGSDEDDFLHVFSINYVMCYPVGLVDGVDHTYSAAATISYRMGRIEPIQCNSINTTEREKMSSLERQLSIHGPHLEHSFTVVPPV